MNYFNYYTEIEERFQQARGSGIFLLSPLDWALIESWKESGVPLEAALKGIDRAFEKWHKRTRKFRQVNSLAYCSQEVLSAAKELAEGGALREDPQQPAGQGFENDRVREFFEANALELEKSADNAAEPLKSTAASAASSLRQLVSAEEFPDLESVEQRLSVLEDKLLAAATQVLSEDQLVEIRSTLQRQLSPYRSKMTADQLSLLERQYVQRAAFEAAGIPRLSLFFLS